MTTTWGVYNVQGKDASGAHVKAAGAGAVKWFVRWRVTADGEVSEHKRTFKQKGHAQTFHSSLIAARFGGWAADSRGWPVSPAAVVRVVDDEKPLGPTFEEYCIDIWYPSVKASWGDKNRLGHRRNMRLAIEFLRYSEADVKVLGLQGVRPGDSMRIEHIVADHVVRAVAQRRVHNARTAGVNERRIRAAVVAGEQEISLSAELSKPATVRAFYVTLAMILRSARDSGLTSRDPLVGTAKHAPKPAQPRVSQRIVPSVDEVFDLSEAIATLGPLASDGRPAGERFRSLVLAAGTLGPRPGELVAHRPEWFDWDLDTPLARFHKTEGAIYDREEGIRGQQVRRLKHREEDEWREIPLLGAVADAIRLHAERGYGTSDRTWTSVTGCALDWHNLMDVYWRPACAKVFGGTAKSQLVDMTPNLLRKAAITFWLDSDISPFLAADWAGHSEDVSRRYYAGRSAATYQRELERLARTWSDEGFASERDGTFEG